MFNKKITHALLIGFLAVFSCNAYSTTLQESMLFALKNNPSLKAEKINLSKYREKVIQAFGGFLPQVVVLGKYGWERRKIEIPFYHTSWSKVRQKGYGLAINQNLFHSGSDLALLHAAESSYQVACLKYESDRQALALRVVIDYMQVVQNSSILSLNQHNEKLSEEHLAATKHRYYVGQETKTAVSSVLANYSKARADVVQASANLQNASTQFLEDVGFFPNHLENPHFLFPELQSLATSLQWSMKENLDILSAKKSVDAEESELNSKRLGLLPTVVLQAQAGRQFGLNFQHLWAQNQSVMLNVSVPIFQSGIQWSMVRSSEASVARAQESLIAVRRHVMNQATIAWNNYQTALAELDSLTQAVTAARLAYKSMNQEYRVGSKTFLDTMDAQNILLTNEVALIKAQASKIIAEFQLLRIYGMLSNRFIERLSQYKVNTFIHDQYNTRKMLKFFNNAHHFKNRFFHHHHTGRRLFFIINRKKHHNV